MTDIINRILDDFSKVRFSTFFGSAVQGRLTVHSDIDIAVAAERKLIPEYKIRLSQALSSADDQDPK